MPVPKKAPRAPRKRRGGGTSTPTPARVQKTFDSASWFGLVTREMVKSVDKNKQSSQNENVLLEARKALAVGLARDGNSIGASQVSPDEALEVLREFDQFRGLPEKELVEVTQDNDKLADAFADGVVETLSKLTPGVDLGMSLRAQAKTMDKPAESVATDREQDTIYSFARSRNRVKNFNVRANTSLASIQESEVALQSVSSAENALLETDTEIRNDEVLDISDKELRELRSSRGLLGENVRDGENLTEICKKWDIDPETFACNPSNEHVKAKAPQIIGMQ